MRANGGQGRAVLEGEAQEAGALVGVAEGAGLVEELASDGLVGDKGGEVLAQEGAMVEGFLVELGEEEAEEAPDGVGENGGAGQGGHRNLNLERD
jgi:hypothetical protein